MSKKIDPAVKERAVRLVREYRSEYSSLTAPAAAVARHERLGIEAVRRWALQAGIDAGDRLRLTSEENEQIQSLTEGDGIKPVSFVSAVRDVAALAAARFLQRYSVPRVVHAHPRFCDVAAR